MSTALPMIPGLNPSRRRRKVISRPEVFFKHIDPTGEPSHTKFLNDRDIFKNKNEITLKFYASFDNRGEPANDRMQFRDCHVLYFVGDGTIKVYEPKLRNSGMVQGCLVNRNLIPKPEGGFYRLDDLKIGETVVFFGKSFKLLDCDPFTKTFLREMGYRVNSPEPRFTDPVTADRSEKDMHRSNIHKPMKKCHKGEVFLKNFPSVLRFYGIYKRSETQFEEERYVSIYYQLYDGRMKIIDDEKLRNAQEFILVGGHDSYIVLKPMHVPKTLKNLSVDHIGNGRTILNLSGNTKDTRLDKLLIAHRLKQLGTFVDDRNPPPDRKEQDFYTPEDLELGKTIDIFGAKVFLYDCDEFTKEFYKHKFDKEFVPVTLPELKRFKYRNLVYPQEFGKPSDSLTSCWKIGPSSNKKITNMCNSFSILQNKGGGSENLLQFHRLCRDGLDGKILRFLSNILTDEPIKKHDFFVISFYLEDDTIEINKFDLNQTCNYGLGRIHLHRMKVAKPTTNPVNANNCFYQKSDLYVGNVICANSEQHYLFDADEYTLKYMEEHSNIFPHSNFQLLMNTFQHFLREKANSLKTAFESADVSQKGVVSYDNFRNIIRQHLPQEESVLTPEQQIITLARFSCLKEYIGPRFEELVSRVQAELRRQRFQDFDKLKESFELFDVQYGNRTGFFTTTNAYNILLSFPLNINKDLLKLFIFKFPTKESLIDYLKVIHCLDYVKHPAVEPDKTPYAFNLNWKEEETDRNMDKIDYHSFLNNLTREKCPECNF
ncbi:EF-hand domain-containing family member C2 [Trichonephila clavata]|uniref:EF-hand domain-containing family member C2 n=1 Tax=Trichonephila clavata TaxID=2740835 RepID=A0A8X6FJK5_TRICU|nr:EF-hand domain-containing family member C2 [Trichonephila clavata]